MIKDNRLQLLITSYYIIIIHLAIKYNNQNYTLILLILLILLLSFINNNNNKNNKNKINIFVFLLENSHLAAWGLLPGFAGFQTTSQPQPAPLSLSLSLPTLISLLCCVIKHFMWDVWKYLVIKDFLWGAVSNTGKRRGSSELHPSCWILLLVTTLHSNTFRTLCEKWWDHL